MALRRTTSVPKPETVVSLEPVTPEPKSDSNNYNSLQIYRCTITDCNYQATNKCMYCQRMICLGHYERDVATPTRYLCSECRLKGTTDACGLLFFAVIAMGSFIFLLAWVFFVFYY